MKPIKDMDRILLRIKEIGELDELERIAKEKNKKYPLEYSSGVALCCGQCGSAEYIKNEDGNDNLFCGQCGCKIDHTHVVNTDEEG